MAVFTISVYIHPTIQSPPICALKTQKMGRILATKNMHINHVRCHKTSQASFCETVACTNMQDLLAQVVEHHDVGIHVEQVVGVGRVVVCGPHLRLWAFVREHVVAVFGLVIHAVESCHLQDIKNNISAFAKQISHNACVFLRQCKKIKRLLSFTFCLLHLFPKK